MASANVKVDITGAKEFAEACDKFPREAQRYMQMAGEQSARYIVHNTVGIDDYPPAGKGNAPPAPYYWRGHGMVNARGQITQPSETYGRKWTTEPHGYGVVIGNKTTYAAKLTDDQLQKPVMARIGWRKIIEVIKKDKWAQIVDTFNLYVTKLIRDVGL